MEQGISVVAATIEMVEQLAKAEDANARLVAEKVGLEGQVALLRRVLYLAKSKSHYITTLGHKTGYDWDKDEFKLKLLEEEISDNITRAIGNEGAPLPVWPTSAMRDILAEMTGMEKRLQKLQEELNSVYASIEKPTAELLSKLFNQGHEISELQRKNEAMEFNCRHLPDLIEVAERHGWNGVDNSKLMHVFLDEALSTKETPVIQELPAEDVFPALKRYIAEEIGRQLRSMHVTLDNPPPASPGGPQSK
jgi:hypothetical protein